MGIELQLHVIVEKELKYKYIFKYSVLFLKVPVDHKTPFLPFFYIILK